MLSYKNTTIYYLFLVILISLNYCIFYFPLSIQLVLSITSGQLYFHSAMSSISNKLFVKILSFTPSLTYREPYKYNLNNQDSQLPSREIFLTGDSLMQLPEHFFSFSSKFSQGLKLKHSSFNVKVKSFTQNSYRLYNISAGLQEIFRLREQGQLSLPDAVVIFENTEMYEEFMGPKLNHKHQMVYLKALSQLIRFLSSKVKYVIVVGLPFFGPSGEIIETWDNSDDKANVLLEQYLKLNSEICHKYHNAVHLNSRDIFQNFILESASQGIKPKKLNPINGIDPKTFNFDNNGILTFDGSHLNMKGSDLMLKLLIDQLEYLPGFWDDNEKNRGKHRNKHSIRLQDFLKIENKESVKELLTDLKKLHENKIQEKSFYPLSSAARVNSESFNKNEDIFVQELLKDSDADNYFDEGGMNIGNSSYGNILDDRADWSPQKRSCFEWRDQYEVLVGVSWGKLPFELQQKWELYNCNDYMDCHTAACSYHSGTLDHFNHDHPIFQRPQSAADWEIANGFIPQEKVQLMKLRRKRFEEKHGRHSNQ